MTSKNIVFIATSLDGYIADRNGGIDWLHSIPNPNNIDMGYQDIMESIDALLMGRKTFETVCNFDIPWPYDKPVFALTNSLNETPLKCGKNVHIVSGELKDIIKKINNQGFYTIYIDGGSTIQSFLQEDLIHEITITTIPILLGGGTPLFSNLDNPLHFKCVKTEIFLDQVVQSKFVRIQK